MNAQEIKRKTDKAARVYLEMRGFTLLEQNWRLSRSKIDVVATKNGIIYFIEVKYVAGDTFTHPPEILTASDVARRQLSAASWIEDNRFVGNYFFASLEIAGSNFTVMNFNEEAQQS